MVISASTAKLLNFTQMVQNVTSESYLGSSLRKRFSSSGELQLSFRVSASLSVRRCLFQASYTAAEAYLGQGLNLADATQLALQTPSCFCPFSLHPLLHWKNLAKMYADLAAVHVGLSLSASAVL